MTLDPLVLAQQIRRAALDLGFSRVGFTSTAPLSHRAFLERWLAQRMHGGMSFMADSLDLRCHPAQLLEGARSAIVVVASYAVDDSSETFQSSPTRVEPLNPRAPELAQSPRLELRGKIARFASGMDYHIVLRDRLNQLGQAVQRLVGKSLSMRVVVDTAPLLERELAMRAGVGFIGKNTLLITPRVGSYTFLGTLLVPLDLPPDTPALPRCGRCELCLKACPTGALLAPYWLDAGRCISYLTIEHRGVIDVKLLDHWSPWLFGCDRCQEVCPYNARAGERAKGDFELAPANRLRALPLLPLLDLKSGAYRRLVRGRALHRVSRLHLMRNAILAAGFQGAGTDSGWVQILGHFTEHSQPALREAARWSLINI